MAAWTQSHFLQALGWATLNSIWQMALLWALFSGANHTVRLSALQKYKASVGAMLIGFAWAVSTFFFYYQNYSSTYAFFETSTVHSNNLLNVCLLAASVSYLLLLVFPAVRLYKNWRFVQTIQKEGHRKAQLDHRLFVQKAAFLLGITKKVRVVVSSLVSSPVTVGYLKPVILLPVAVMNNLTTAQVESVLLHELSHIRRNDYLLNFLVSVIHTLLYFNPFAKSFMRTIEAEREACCDELVLQFGCDKVSYASALLHLEKSSGRHLELALAAAGKQNLLTRIEKIVGMEKKKPFRLVQIVPVLLTMFCVFLFNSVMIIRDAKSGEGILYSGNAVLSPWRFEGSSRSAQQNTPGRKNAASLVKDARNDVVRSELNVEVYNHGQAEETDPVAPVLENIVPVDFDEVDGSLSKEEKENVKATVEATKEVAKTLQWKTIEYSIGDAMSSREKAVAKLQYFNELDKVSWSNIEQNLKANYDKLNWDQIKLNVDHAMLQVKMDSLQTLYAQALREIGRTEKIMKSKSNCGSNPMPDASLEEIQTAKETLQKNLDSIKTATQQKKVIRL